MDALVRVFLSAVTFVVAFYAVYWIPVTRLIPNWPWWVSLLLALCGAILAARFVWTNAASTARSGLATAIALGALTVGGIGFSIGFFGPLVFAPEANQGPLLGIFITGPLGAIVGAIGGAVRWRIKRPITRTNSGSHPSERTTP